MTFVNNRHTILSNEMIKREMLMNAEKVSAYFRRIGLVYNPAEKADIDLLKKLHYAHVVSVPYETTDIVDGISLSLEDDELYEKIVTERRGGYCFELNGIFAWLLRELGYNVDEYFARFLRGEPEPPKPRHRVLAVTINGSKYLCDVGVGSKAPRFPLVMKENIEQEQCGEVYKFIKDDFLGWIIMEKTGNEWTPYFSFTENRQLKKDFYTPSFYCEKHPDSPFLYNMISLKTETGRYTVDKNEFRIWENNAVTDSRTVSDEELEKICVEYFGMTLHRERKFL